MADVKEFLDHHGVKGMKWGVRSDKGHEGERATTKKIAKLDKKFARKTGTLGTFADINNRAAVVSNTVTIPRINNKPEYKGKDFTRDTPLRRKYYKEHQDQIIKNLEQAAKESGTNASGTKRYGIYEGADGSWQVTLRDVEHADFKVTITPSFDNTGHLVSIKFGNGVLEQSDIESFLDHYGTKGMKWGVRKRSGGVSKPRSADSKKIAELRKRKPHQLTNKQLKDVNARLNMEQNFSKLNPGKVQKGHNVAKGILALAGTATALYGLTQTPGGKAAIALGKKYINVQLASKQVNSKMIDVSKFQRSAQGTLF